MLLKKMTVSAKGRRMAKQTVCYRKQPRTLNLEIYTPDQPQSHALAAVVFFFGGGWVNGNTQQFSPYAEHLARRGMIAILADYRVQSRDDNPPFECVSDGKSAMRYVRAHAREFGIDPDRIAAAGGSAGGHVAAATACVERWDHPSDNQDISPCPNALALFNPVINNGPDNYGFDRVADYYEDFSPFHRVHKQWPPSTVMLGTEDALIPVAMMKTFAASIRDQGGRCDEHYYEGQTHGFFNHKAEGNVYYDQTLQVLDDFMVSIGYLDTLA